MKTEIYGMYCKDYDMTFVIEDRYSADGQKLSTKVVGLYHGEPEDRLSLKFYGKTEIDHTEYISLS